MTEPAERADHLVADEQYVVLVADLADPLEVSRWGRNRPAGVLHRFEKDGRDGIGALELDGLGDAIGGPPAERFLIGAIRTGSAGRRDDRE